MDFVPVYLWAAAVHLLGDFSGGRRVFSDLEPAAFATFSPLFPGDGAAAPENPPVHEKKWDFFAKTRKKTLFILGKIGYNKSNTIFSEPKPFQGEALMKGLLGRLLAAMLGLYLSFGMCQAATGLAEASAQGAALRAERDTVAAEIQRLRQSVPRSEEELRQWAFCHHGLVSPGDIVFLDGG